MYHKLGKLALFTTRALNQGNYGKLIALGLLQGISIENNPECCMGVY